MLKPKQIYGLFNEGDVVTDTEGWYGKKRFIVYRFCGNDWCPTMCVRSANGVKPKMMNMDARDAELRDNPYRPLRNADLKLVARMAAKGVREARREIVMRNNDRRLK